MDKMYYGLVSWYLLNGNIEKKEKRDSELSAWIVLTHLAWSIVAHLNRFSDHSTSIFNHIKASVSTSRLSGSKAVLFLLTELDYKISAHRVVYSLLLQSLLVEK